LSITRAAAMCFETGKFRESTIRTDPPLLSRVAAIDFKWKVYRYLEGNLFAADLGFILLQRTRLLAGKI